MTAEPHAACEAAIEASGSFSSRAAYAEFLARLHRFQSAAERMLSRGADELWPWTARADLIARDLDSLGAPASQRPPSVGHVEAPDAAALFGIGYVVEGSSLGARLLVRRCAALGLGRDSGAAYFATLADDRTTWPAYLAALEHASLDAEEEMRMGQYAREAFGVAEACFTGGNQTWT
jgi:heme oxygenase